MKRFRFSNLKYQIKTFGLIRGIRFWIKEIMRSHERCAYCGWYLHPQLIFEDVISVQKLCIWKEKDDLFVCAKCHFIKKII